ncbi:MAG: cellulase family glycosylhydrolase [Deltaproteobacteria bacterium]|nr:cellulase family glycosylhydrolase [Deltaproteobacteria bacterium]
MNIFLLAATLALAALPGHSHARLAGFVKVNGTRFEVDGKRYAFVGTNFWYGMNLGVEGRLGDRPRLLRELDRLKALGVTNLRVLAGSEGPDSEPWRIVPSLQQGPRVYSAALLRGLDFLISEMGKRGMRAVVCLNNFWPWSGGMAQYVAWHGGGSIPYPPPAANGSWSTYQEYTQRFYSNEAAMRDARVHARAIVTRFANEPTIMAWELANEPRGVKNVEAFNAWLDGMAAYIKSLDPNHLVTTGSEGETPSPAGAGMDFVRNHSSKHVDYATAHIWAQNWEWYDPADSQKTYATAVQKMKAYLHDHAEKARQLGKPLVIEEFGIGRDGGSFDANAPTTVRDRYYAEVFGEVLAVARAPGSAVSGVNFWAWAGEARPRKPGAIWKRGMPFIGDPPHEQQGWYSVYAHDFSTTKVIAEFAERMSRL